MAIKEIDPGQSHTFASTPLVVELTGSRTGVVLSALDQSGAEAVKNRIGDSAVVLTPRPRRLRLVARPVRGGTFPAGTMLGLSLRTEGTASALVEIVVANVDVAALPDYELAIVEFAPGRSVLTVPGRVDTYVEPVVDVSVSGAMFGSPEPAVPPAPARHAAPGAGSTPAPSTVPAAAPAAAVPEDAGHAWLEAGRYAVREAARLPGSPPLEALGSWGLVVDGSVSMRRMHEAGQLDPLVGLLCGVHVEWSRGRWAVASVVAGTRAREVATTSTQPRALSTAAFGPEVSPSSWSATGAAVAVALRRVGPGGAVAVLTDGVPGDLEELSEVLAASPGCRVAIVTTGTSPAHGLESDAEQHWWREELSGLERLAELPQVSVVAIQLTEDGRLRLGDRRPAELARRVMQGAGGRVG